MTIFNPLNVPDQWNQYFTKYPQGYTLLEALMNWVQQVNDMVDNQNTLNTTWTDWETTNNKTIADFLAQYDTHLQDTLSATLTDWQNSGLLDFIINAAIQTQVDDVQTQVDQLFSQKADVTTVNNRIQSLGNGSPKGVYPTLTDLQSAFPTGTTGIYVVLSDGKWYYWNNAWVAGGVYQSSGLASKSVTEDNLTSDVLGKYAKKVSNVASVANLAVNAKKTITFPYNVTVSERAGLIFNGSKEPENTLTISSINLFTSTLFNGAVSSLAGVNQRITTIDDDTFKVLSDGTGSQADALVTLSIMGLQLEPNTSYCLSSVNSVKYTNYGTKAYLGNWSIIGDSVLLMSGSANNQKVFTTGASGKIDLKLNIQNSLTPVGTTQEITVANCILAKASAILPYTRYHVDYTEYIPAFDGDYKTTVNVLNGDVLKVGSPITTADYETYTAEVTTANQKTLVCFGDSITGVFVGSDRDYPLKIANNTNLKVYNVGFGGTRMGQHPTPNYDAFCMYRLANAVTSHDYTLQNADTSGSPEYPQNLATLKSIDFNTVDYVTIAFGTNDWGGGNTPNPPTDNPTNLYDTTNYIGATRYVIKTLLTAYPHLKILLVSPYYRFDYVSGTDSDDGWRPQYNPTHALTEYVDALVNTGKENKIPVLDMYRTLGMNKYNRGYYFNSDDGVHPLSTGMELIADRISGQLKALYYV